MENGVMIQYFEWNLPDDGKHWEGQISSWILQMQNEWKVDLASLRNFIS